MYVGHLLGHLLPPEVHREVVDIIDEIHDHDRFEDQPGWAWILGTLVWCVRRLHRLEAKTP